MNGLHLIADLHDCQCPSVDLLDAEALSAYCVDACQRHGLTVVGQIFHQFRTIDGLPAGATGTVVLAESHVAVHTWPELSCATLDIYVCNFSCDNSHHARTLFADMIQHFQPGRSQIHELTRGALHRESGEALSRC